MGELLDSKSRLATHRGRGCFPGGNEEPRSGSLSLGEVQPETGLGSLREVEKAALGVGVGKTPTPPSTG